MNTNVLNEIKFVQLLKCECFAILSATFSFQSESKAFDANASSFRGQSPALVSYSPYIHVGLSHDSDEMHLEMHKRENSIS